MSGLEKLRARVTALGEGTARRYPVELKAELVAAATSLRDRGKSWERVSEALDVSAETVRRWCVESEVTSTPRARRLVPVHVDRAVAHRGVVVVTPGGLRVEGLELDEAAELVRALT